MRQTRTSKKRERALTMSNPISIDDHSSEEEEEEEVKANFDINEGAITNKTGKKTAVPAFNIADVEGHKTNKTEETSKGGINSSTQANSFSELNSLSYLDAEETFFTSASGLPRQAVPQSTTASSDSSSYSEDSDDALSSTQNLTKHKDDSDTDDLTVVKVLQFPDSKKFLRQRKRTKRQRPEGSDLGDHHAKKPMIQETKKVSSPTPPKSAKIDKAEVPTRRSTRTQALENAYLDEDSDLELLGSNHDTPGMPLSISV